MESVEICKFSFNKVTVFNEYRGSRANYGSIELSYYDVSENEHLGENEVQSRAHLGTLSQQAHTNLLTSIKKFVWVTRACNLEKQRRREKHQKTLKFVTLTLASDQIHSDNMIKEELLNQFLTELRQDYDLKNYLWKAEKQKKWLHSLSHSNRYFYTLVGYSEKMGANSRKIRLCFKI